MRNMEAEKIRKYGKDVLTLSIIIFVVQVVLTIFSSSRNSEFAGWNVLGFGLLVYFFARGLSEIIELLHFIAIGIGTVDPDTNSKRFVSNGNALLDMLSNISKKEIQPKIE